MRALTTEEAAAEGEEGIGEQIEEGEEAEDVVAAETEEEASR